MENHGLLRPGTAWKSRGGRRSPPDRQLLAPGGGSGADMVPQETRQWEESCLGQKRCIYSPPRRTTIPGW